jgi:signal transduction histidine kinase
VLFLLLPFTAYFSLGRRVSYAVAAGCLGLVLVSAVRAPGGPGNPEVVSDVLMFGVGLVFALTMAALAADHVAQTGALATAMERNRLARDIHDGLGHHLTAISVQLEKATAFRDRDPAAADRAVADARRSARYALSDVRGSVATLRTDGSFALGRAVADLTRDLGDTRVELAVTGQETNYTGATLMALYRAAQEGLTNVRKHAAARTVTVALDLGESVARLHVADDGRGFVPAAADGGFGLRGMRERLELVGGSLVVDSVPGRGTELTVCVPR